MQCTLRTWKLEDAPVLASVLSDRKVRNALREGLSGPSAEQDAAAYIRSALADPQNTFAYAMELDGAVAGSIGAFRQGGIHHRTAELGYCLAEQYRGRGLMTDAVRQLCAKLFSETDILRIYAEPFAYNTASRRVLEKAGFRLEGILKNNAVKNGQVLDMALYALTRAPGPCPVRRLNPEEIPQALDLIWEVFLQFEAPEYTQEGVDFFRASLDDPARTRALTFYGAFDGDALVGALCMRAPQHIGDFFVRADHHRRGIGRALFETMRREYDEQVFTVHSSRCAVGVYRHLGFVPVGPEQVVNGLRFTPMRYEKPHT